MRKSIPKTMVVLGYRILIEKSSPKEIEEETGKRHDAFWLSLLEGMSQFAGRIMIDKSISRFKQWRALWHEVEHAITDISDWDLDKRQMEEEIEGLCLDCGKNRQRKEVMDAPDA